MAPDQHPILFFDATMTSHSLLLSALERTPFEVVTARSNLEVMMRLRTGRYAALVTRTDPRGTQLLPLLQRLAHERRIPPLVVLADGEACTAVRVARAHGAAIRTLNSLHAFEPANLLEAMQEAIYRRNMAQLRPAHQVRRGLSLRERIEQLLAALMAPRAWRWQ
jgi:DNA-binding NtrC family response regulator